MRTTDGAPLRAGDRSGQPAGKCVRASLGIWQTPEFEVGTNIDYLFKRFCRNKISLIQTLVGV